MGIDFSVIDAGRGALLFDAAALWPLIRIFRRTGLSPYLASLVFVPVAGLLLMVTVLALARWPLIPPLPKPLRKARRVVPS